MHAAHAACVGAKHNNCGVLEARPLCAIRRSQPHTRVAALQRKHEPTFNRESANVTSVCSTESRKSVIARPITTC